MVYTRWSRDPLAKNADAPCSCITLSSTPVVLEARDHARQYVDRARVPRMHIHVAGTLHGLKLRPQP